jgi:hypothetical protein
VYSQLFGAGRTLAFSKPKRAFHQRTRSKEKR